jgi:hypothetical protein
MVIPFCMPECYTDGQQRGNQRRAEGAVVTCQQPSMAVVSATVVNANPVAFGAPPPQVSLPPTHAAWAAQMGLNMSLT